MTAEYRGYPYVNTIVTDVPTFNPAAASRWTNLPRRQLMPSIPGPSGSGTGPAVNAAPNPASSVPPKRDSLNPVVYIDLPQEGGSDVCERIESDDEEPRYVQDTILYDPFENRRITPKDEEQSEQASSSDQNAGPSQVRPVRPNTLDIMVPGPSSSRAPQAPYRPGLPAFLEKESGVYGSRDPDGFPTPPIPMSQFPEPPPAYTEMAEAPSGQQSPVGVSPEPVPPRTQVILPSPVQISPIGIMTFDRKTLTCHHCGDRVHTIVIRETGYMTHVIAFFVFIFLFPIFVLVYCFECTKHKNHYCPNCNKLIGYQLPLCGESMHLVA